MDWVTNLSWTDNQEVSLSLWTPELAAAPTDLVVTAGTTQLDLRWTAPSGTVRG